MYSQNNEEEVILKYFGNKVGTLIDIGANDGKTFSNSLALIERGWQASLVDPSPTCYDKLKELHKDNGRVDIYQLAIGTETKGFVLHESGSLINENDYSLVSTIKEEEKKRWESINMQWKEIKVACFSWKDFYANSGMKYDFISIDAEGFDYEILSQMNLTELGCSLICVEHNMKDTNKYIDYIKQFGHKLLLINQENLIFGL